MKNKAFSIGYNFTIAAGAFQVETFDLINNNQEFKLRSIFYDLYINETLSGLRLDLQSQTTQLFALQIGGAGGQMLTQHFLNIATPAMLAFNGDGFLLHYPNTGIKFENFFISNILPVTVIMTNNDALISYDYNFSVIMEID